MNEFEKALSRIKKNIEPDDNWTTADYEHYRAVMTALERMTPQKLVLEKTEHRSSTHYLRQEFYRCPNCHIDIFIQTHKEIEDGNSTNLSQYVEGEKTEHCWHCGQALIWEGLEC